MDYIKETNIKIIFSIYGEDFIPEEITQKTGLISTNMWRIGDEIRKGLYRKENAWELSTSQIITLNIDEVISGLVEKVEPKIEILNDFILDKSLMCKMDIVVEVWDNNQPGMFIDSEVIKALSFLNCSIDIDLYLYNNVE